MTAAEERAGELRRLILELRADLAAIAELTAFAGTVAGQAQPAPPPDRRDQMALALTIHHVYTAAEQAMLRVAKAFDRSPYAGTDWHRDLLKNMAAELPGIRPAVLGPGLRRALDEYRGFRHIVRHGYDYELDWRRMQPLLERLPALAAEIKADLDVFISFVEACIAALPQE